MSRLEYPKGCLNSTRTCFSLLGAPLAANQTSNFSKQGMGGSSKSRLNESLTWWSASFESLPPQVSRISYLVVNVCPVRVGGAISFLLATGEYRIP